MGVDRRDRSASLDSLGRRKRRSDRARSRADSSASSSSSRSSRSRSRSRHRSSRSHRSRRSRSRSRERGREREQERGRYDDRRHRSRSRSRSNSPPAHRRQRSRSRSHEPKRQDHGGKTHEDHSVQQATRDEAEAPAGAAAPVSQMSEEEQMRMMLGFGGFDSTKGKAVDDNLQGAALGAARKETKREYRQYMNRRGGFNRPLDQR